jgi:hypothetical protein
MPDFGGLDRSHEFNSDQAPLGCESRVIGPRRRRSGGPQRSIPCRAFFARGSDAERAIRWLAATAHPRPSSAISPNVSGNRGGSGVRYAKV